MASQETAAAALKGALEYAARGWPVFPAKDKKPLVKWKDEATTDEQQIRKWAADGAEQWGFSCEPAGITVVDVDPGADEDFVAEHLDLNPLLSVRTPRGGRHLYYRGRYRSSTSAISPHVDTRGVGGYVIVPDGISYIVESADGDGTPPDIVHERLAPRTSAEQEPPAAEKDLPHNVDRARQWLETANPAVEGQGGDALTVNTAMWLRDFGCSEEMAHKLMAESWNARCLPPWDPEQLRDKVRNAYVYAKLRAGGKTPEAEQEAALDAFQKLSADAAGIAAPGVMQEDVEVEVQLGWFNELGDAEPPEREWHVKNWLPLGPSCPTLITGDGGTGKSLLAIQLCMSLSSGAPWIGFDIAAKGPTLYVFCEDSEDELRRRRWDILTSGHYEGVTGEGFAWVSRIGKDAILCRAMPNGSGLTPQPFYGLLSGAMRRCREKLDTNAPGLLVLDTLADVFGGDEINRTIVNQFVKHYLVKLGLMHNFTPVILGHPPKNEATYSGSTAWNNSFRNRLYLDWYDPEMRNNYRALSRQKSNYASADERVHLKWDRGVLVPVCKADMLHGLLDALCDIISKAAAEGRPMSNKTASPRCIYEEKIVDGEGHFYSGSAIREALKILYTERRIVLQNRADKYRQAGIYPAEQSSGDAAALFA